MAVHVYFISESNEKKSVDDEKESEARLTSWHERVKEVALLITKKPHTHTHNSSKDWRIFPMKFMGKGKTLESAD